MEQQTFDLLLLTMSALAVVVFAALYYVRAGYGMFQTSKWGISLNNKLGWILMEAPVFFVMLYLWWNSSVRCSAVPLVFFLLFELHYFQRAFIFPFLMKGKSRMPIAIMLMGVVFNVLNGFMQGEWLFYLAPEGLYSDAWLNTSSFWAGLVLFFAGMGINIHSDSVIVKRTLERKTVGDTDVGKVLKERIADLEALLDAYRSGQIIEKI